MSVPETVLIYVGSPLGLFAMFAAFVYGPAASRAPRYRPGRAWTHDPVWFLPHEHHSALEATHQAQLEGTAGTSATTAKTGGASGEW
jgi:hypothetical protein